MTDEIKIKFTDEELEITAQHQEMGYVKIYRSMLNWEWYQNPNTMRVFLHCLMKANHKDGKFQGVEVPRGCFISSENIIAKELKLSRQNVRTALKHLISTQELTKELTKGLAKVGGAECTLFKVKKYDLYQMVNQGINQGSNLTLTTNNNNKELNNNIYSREKGQKTPSSEVIEVVEYLNKVTGSNYKPTTQETMRKINGRLKDYSVEDLKKVIDYKHEQWKGTDFAMYLRPKTLFSESKFESYLQDANIKQQEQKKKNKMEFNLL